MDKDVGVTFHVYDNKGREYKPPRESNPVKLSLKLKWEDLSENGDYAWVEVLPQGDKSKAMEGLVLACPFCRSDAPVPYTAEIESKEPLTVKGELHCGFCRAAFHLIKGEAIRSWKAPELSGGR